MKVKVICIHLGARAHYLIPKALESNNVLSLLITDTWIKSSFFRTLIAKVPVRLVKSFSNRYAEGIPAISVQSFNLYFLMIELWVRVKYKNDWTRIKARNVFFEDKVIKICQTQSANDALLGFSYTSLKAFAFAKLRGQKTILFQIDPGFVEEEIVGKIVVKYHEKFKTSWTPAPRDYWEDWMEECNLADVIMVNSEWSKMCLIKQGVANYKIKIIVLPFQLQRNHSEFKKIYPPSFTTERPMRCLFLGTLTLRKGIHLVLEVAEKLSNCPIEFILVGQSELDDEILKLPNIQYKGTATRAETDLHYKQADVFLFPTLSDGFGLTQLEAMAWQLPVIASKCCGEVVVDGYNGITLSDCNTQHLTDALLKLLDKPELVAHLSSNCINTVKQFSLKKFADELSALTE